MSGYADIRGGRFKVTSRNYGFLQQNERAYLTGRGLYAGTIDAESGGRQAKYRIENEILSHEGIQNVVRTFHRDLLGVQMYLLHTDGGEWFDFQNYVLPHVREDLEELRDNVDRLIKLADQEEFTSQRQELQNAIQALRYDFDVLEDFRKNRGRDLLPGVEWENGRPVEPEQLANEWNEEPIRKAALMGVLDRDGLHRILEYLHANGKDSLPDETIGEDGQTMSQAASQVLVNKYGLVEKDEISNSYREYELTDRGEAVYRAWKALESAAIVEVEADTLGISKQEAARLLLYKYFNADEWREQLGGSVQQ